MAKSKLIITIGIDFGTSLTKICIRADDTEKSEVLSFGSPILDDAFLLSKIGIKFDGYLLAGLTKAEWDKQKSLIQVEVDFIKMRLANLDIPQESILFKFKELPRYKNTILDKPTHIESLCVYYLAKVIIRAKQ